ncbi:MAG: hypothetical protein ACREMN_05055 [Gemmatimonadales bacterium]
MRSRVAASVGLLLAVAVVACGERARGGTAGITVRDIELGRSIKSDLSIETPTDEFRATDVIYASIATSGSGPATLTARWLFEGDQVVTETSQTVSPTGPARTEFHLSRPTGLPAGRYRLEILLNGVLAGTEEFEVE